MTNFVKDTINALLSTNKRDNSKLTKEREARELKKNAFIQEYSKIKQNVLKPVLREIQDQLNHKDIHSEIKENNDTQKRIARELNSITIYFPIIYTTKKTLYDYPYVAFRANSHTETVNVCESTSGPDKKGHVAPIGDYKLSEITPELVREKVMAVLETIL